MPVLIKTKRRLRTLKSLNSIFNALQVITIARLQKVKTKHKRAEQYLAEIMKIARQLDFSKIYKKNRTARNLAVLISPNRGFCGAFNQNLLYRTDNFIKESASAPEFIVFGRKGLDFLRKKKQSIINNYMEEEYSFNFFAKLAAEILQRYYAGEIAEANFIFNRYMTVMRQDAVANRVIPREGISPPAIDRYIIEPDKELAAEKVFEQLLAAELYFSYLDSQLGEISARMFTMKGAIENSKELIGGLTIELNKARQQSITRDLLEIIASSESLKEGSY